MIYCVSAPGNTERRARMQQRADQVGLACSFLDDPLTAAVVSARVAALGQTEPAGFDARTTAIMMDHLALIQWGVATGASHMIICEDDICLRRTFTQNLPAIVKEFDARGLDVLLLGYLWPWREAAEGYQFHAYANDLWGSQMYLLSRRHARYLIETFTLSWALEHAGTQPFSPDWICTKVGRRARLSPMLAVEEGAVPTGHPSHVEFHRQCFEAQDVPDLFV